jgi:hypothetical protein
MQKCQRSFGTFAKLHKPTHIASFAKEPNIQPYENSNICQYSDLLAFF